ncbi:hypothetical protein HAX54_005071, partial [Datura stramonium]|nr:hypothetical protein [Datura stramonium]
DATGASNSCVRPKRLCTLTKRCVVYKLILLDAIQTAQGVKDNNEVPTGRYYAHRAYEVMRDYTEARRAI